MERLKDGRLEFVAHFLRSLAQDVLEAVLLGLFRRWLEIRRGLGHDGSRVAR